MTKAVEILVSRLEERFRPIAAFDVEVEAGFSNSVWVRVWETFGCVLEERRPLLVGLYFHLPPYTEDPSYGDKMMQTEKHIVSTVLCAVRMPFILQAAKYGASPTEVEKALDNLRKAVV